MSSDFLVLSPIGALLAGLLLELALARVLSSRAKGWLAFLSSLAALGGVLALWPMTRQGQALQVNLLAWDGPASLAYRVDGLSQLFALMAAGIGAAVLLYSVAYMAEEPGTTRFYALMLLFVAGLIHLVYSADLLVVYVSWEVIGLCSFLLVGFWYGQAEAAAGARKVLVMTHIAGYGLLAAVLVLYVRTGSTLWSDPQVAAAFGTGLFLLTLLAALAKSVQFPLHTWIPDAMAAPTPVSALLHAACYVKAGVYLIARLHSLGAWPVAWQALVIWLGTITMLVGVLYAMVQSDLKRMLAFHTVSQIGYMVLGLGLSTPLGIAAGLLHCLNHGLFKSGLFLCSGAVQRATGTRDMDRLGGLARRMPATTIMWLVVAGSISGVPLLSGFVSKWLLYNAALQARQPLPALIAWVVSVLTLFSFLKATASVFLGEESAGSALAPHRAPAPNPAAATGGATGSYEAPRAMLVGMAALAAASALLGVAPQLAVRYVINPLLLALPGPQAPVIGISWLGLTAGGGSWFATGGLILALAALAAGGLIYRLALLRRQPVAAGAALSGGVFTGGEPLHGPGRLPASDFSLIVKDSLAPFYAWAEVDRYYLALWRRLLGASHALARAQQPAGAARRAGHPGAGRSAPAGRAALHTYLRYAGRQCLRRRLAAAGRQRAGAAGPVPERAEHAPSTPQLAAAARGRLALPPRAGPPPAAGPADPAGGWRAGLPGPGVADGGHAACGSSLPAGGAAVGGSQPGRHPGAGYPGGRAGAGPAADRPGPEAGPGAPVPVAAPGGRGDPGPRGRLAGGRGGHGRLRRAARPARRRARAVQPGGAMARDCPPLGVGRRPAHAGPAGPEAAAGLLYNRRRGLSAAGSSAGRRAGAGRRRPGGSGPRPGQGAALRQPVRPGEGRTGRRSASSGGGEGDGLALPALGRRLRAGGAGGAGRAAHGRLRGPLAALRRSGAGRAALPGASLAGDQPGAAGLHAGDRPLLVGAGRGPGSGRSGSRGPTARAAWAPPGYPGSQPGAAAGRLVAGLAERLVLTARRGSVTRRERRKCGPLCPARRAPPRSPRERSGQQWPGGWEVRAISGQVNR